MMNHRYRIIVTAVLIALLGVVSLAQAAIDTPSLSVGMSGHSKQALTVTAGPSGLPDGFTLWWMDAAQFAASGGVWPSEAVSNQGFAVFSGAPTLNTFGGTQTTFQLAPNQSIVIEIGDLADESGVAGKLAELQYGMTYHFVAFARDADGNAASGLSLTVTDATTTSTNCTYTWGYWRNHLELWPAGPYVLGTVVYTQAELVSIFDEPVAGNGLISLAHQLIAAKLNIAAGADPTAAAAAIAAADALIGSLVVPPVGSGYLAPSSTSSLTQTLDDYNNGVIGPGHCATVPVSPMTWGMVKGLYR
jgi:hypothetical protein